MSLAHCGAADPKHNGRTHSHNLSVNSISSISEPTTPPAMSLGVKSYLWDSHKVPSTVVLPQFNLNDKVRQLSSDLIQNDTDSISSGKNSQFSLKIDKDYLASIAKVPLSLLTHDIPRLAKDQYGCRFLQKRIDQSIVTNAQARMANFKIIFSEILSQFYDLIIDPFGNYLIQRLIDYCSEKDLDFIVKSLNSDLYSLSVNQHGTRALQKFIEKMNNDYQLSCLKQGLGPHIIQLIKDLNGNHVIQKILNKYLPENCQFIYDSIIENLLVVATHKHGCCVLQKCLNHVNATQLSAFADTILDYDTYVRLVNDQFGNYVLQYLISINSIEVDCRLFQNLALSGLGELCNSKFSSNVIEKLMKSCYVNEPVLRSFTELKFTVIRLIFATDINKLINDPYGNYVAQTLIDVLVHPKVNHLVETPAGGVDLMPGLKVLLIDDQCGAMDTKSLQADIIRKWFGNCKIASSFGKRIQLKIAMILNGNSKPSPQKRSTLVGLFPLNASGQYRQLKHNRADMFGTSDFLNRNIPIFGNRIYSQPLLDLTVHSSYNFRATAAHSHQPSASYMGSKHGQYHSPNSTPYSQIHPLAEHLNVEYGLFQMNPTSAYHSFGSESTRYMHNSSYYGPGQTYLNSSAKAPNPTGQGLTASNFNSENISADPFHSTSNQSSYDSFVKNQVNAATQGIYRGHERGGSLNNINFTTTW